MCAADAALRRCRDRHHAESPAMAVPLHCCVIGAGIVGACCALELLRDGHRVTLLEPGEPGAEQAASFGNGAWISPASVVPMSMPGLWKKLPGYLLDADGPFTLRWSALPRLWPWLWRFQRAGATAARVRRTAGALSALLHDAPQRHRELAARIGQPGLIASRGLLYVYPDRAAFDAEALAWSLRRDNGVQWRELDDGALRSAAPQLGPGYRFGALVTDGAHCLDPGRYVAALVSHAVALGAVLLREQACGFVIEHGRLQGVQTGQGLLACDRAVLAAGIASGALAGKAGDAVPLQSERGYHVALHRPGFELEIPLMPSDGKMAITFTAGALRVAGQVELAAEGSVPNWRRADILLKHARRCFPELQQSGPGEVITRWMGHRPSTPDGLPVLGPASACADLLYAFGHGHVGLASAPASASLVADIVAGRSTAADLAPYDVRRFA